LKIEYVASLISSAFALEALALKPGNVHPFTGIRNNMLYEDFVLTANIAQPYITRCIRRGYYHRRTRALFADLIRRALEKVLISTGSNTCLGSLLLIMPISYGVGMILATSKRLSDIKLLLEKARETVLASTVWDAIEFYRAVRKAMPSYIRRTDDVGEQVNVWDPQYVKKLLEKGEGLGIILEKTCPRDMVACEAVTYNLTLETTRFIEKRLNIHGDFRRAVTEAYLHILSENIDTMVLRSRGKEIAVYASRLASEALSRITGIDDESWMKVVRLVDEEFERKGICPGSTADIIVAALAALLISNHNKPYTIYKVL